MMNGQQRVIIENVQPQVDGGIFPAKRILKDRVKIEADIFCDSHDMLSAEILYRHQNGRKWQSMKMKDEVNDCWHGFFELNKLGTYEFKVQAWADKFLTWHRDILKRIDAKTDYAVDLLIGAGIIERVLNEHETMPDETRTFLVSVSAMLKNKRRKPENRVQEILTGRLYDRMIQFPLRDHAVVTERTYLIQVDREKANFSTWYEFFPRSFGKAGKHGTFKDCIQFLPYISEMGFDVIYLPPIHPIGKTNRKGKNNNVTSKPGEPGSPWAIGSEDGGHKAIHPELGTLKDFQNLMDKAQKRGIEIAMDVAFQCSPDHPYIKDHPDWFNQRPDGTLQYAENPPKKYEDIYPINFETSDWENLWEELKSVFIYWIEQGVKIFRVDNPHTKSFRFWEWLIASVREEHLDVIFLAEAFTRPKVMARLAKLGFNQSYTYFTWRNNKYELTTYCEELVNSELKNYFRPNFWPNTPDILPFSLQGANRAAFVQRVILAGTLASNFGLYGPAYELMENIPAIQGKEEYLNSEKYEIKNWNTGHRKSIRKVIARLNKIRKENKALQNMHSLRFHPIENEALIGYSKQSDNGKNIILVIVNLDPHQTHSGWIGLPLHDFGINEDQEFEVHDLLSGSFYKWKGRYNYVELNPGVVPAHIFRINK